MSKGTVEELISLSEWIQACIGVGQLILMGWGLWQIQHTASARSDQMAQLQQENSLQAARRRLLEERGDIRRPDSSGALRE